MNRSKIRRGKMVKKHISVTIAGEGLAQKKIKIRKETISNTEKILKERKAVFEALAKF